MKSHDEILRIYQQHFGHSHEAGLFAVFAAGVEDGKQSHREPVPAKAPSIAVVQPTDSSAGPAAVSARSFPVPGKPSSR